LLIVRTKEQTIQEIINKLALANNNTIELIYWELSQAGLTDDYPIDKQKGLEEDENKFFFGRKDMLE
jgi:hypothetical protein